MKKFLLFASVMFLSTAVITSCGSKEEKDDDKASKDSWSDEVKNAYITKCSESAKLGMGEEFATEYCACTLEKIMAKYPNPSDLGKVSNDDMTSLAMECMTADMMPKMDMPTDSTGVVEEAPVK